MPRLTLDRLEKRETALQGKLAGAEGLAPERVRGLRKRLRRTQRRRRKLVAKNARNAPKKAEATAS